MLLLNLLLHYFLTLSYRQNAIGQYKYHQDRILCKYTVHFVGEHTTIQTIINTVFINVKLLTITAINALC